VGDLKERERWDDYMQYYEEAINNTSTDYALLVCFPDDKKCAVILWVKSFGKKCRNTDIQTPEMDDKIENIELYKEMLAKNKKCSEIQSIFFY
jgi:hypothetical protein